MKSILVCGYTGVEGIVLIVVINAVAGEVRLAIDAAKFHGKIEDFVEWKFADYRALALQNASRPVVECEVLRIGGSKNAFAAARPRSFEEAAVVGVGKLRNACQIGHLDGCRAELVTANIGDGMVDSHARASVRQLAPLLYELRRRQLRGRHAARQKLVAQRGVPTPWTIDELMVL